jgi:fatty acid desaturase
MISVGPNREPWAERRENRPAPDGPAAASPIEWPTIGLAVAIYGAWLSATFWHDRIPLPALILAGGWITAWQGSLQHEIIHGHPTPWKGVNTALGAAPLSLWLPFLAYRQSHLAHHATERLTDPAHDPESRYLRPGAGPGHTVKRASAHVQGPLLGRLALGPIIQIPGFLIAQTRAAIRNEPGVRASWAIHALTLPPILLWLHFACHLSLARYGLCFVYPGASLSLLRSFAEHRADPTPAQRVAVVERAPLFGLLFLNNNLHAAHHAWPGAPWFRLRRLYADNRARLLSANGGLVYDGYREVARRFLFRAHDRIDYPPPSDLVEASALCP